MREAYEKAWMELRTGDGCQALDISAGEIARVPGPSRSASLAQLNGLRKQLPHLTCSTPCATCPWGLSRGALTPLPQDQLS